MTPRQSRRLFKRLAEQIEREHRGAPVPGEIAAGMTKEANRSRYQCFVLVDGKPTPVGPKATQDWAENFAATIKAQIAAGREKTWADPIVLPA